jgi:Lon protease-like protein
MSDDAASLADFSGTVRLFPLPNLVLFPHLIQPLHIFEPRYREMMADALNSDRLIAMALLRPGWEEDYHQNPPIHSVICVGRIFQEEELADGRYNLLLRGLARARVVRELPTDRLYRRAEVELLPEVPVGNATTEQAIRKRFSKVLDQCLTGQHKALSQMRQLLTAPLPLGTLCDVFSFTLPLPVELRQQLLEEVRGGPRARLLLKHLESSTPKPEATERLFPPPFSDN